MLINKMAEKIHIKSKLGQSIFASGLMGLSIFILLSVISYSMKIATISTCLVGSALCAVVTAVFYFVKNLVNQ
jgi:hypothetical protein